MKISVAPARELITISTVAYPEPYIVTIESDSNEPAMPCGYGKKQPVNFRSLDGLNLPMNPFIVMTLASPLPKTEAHILL